MKHLTSALFIALALAGAAAAAEKKEFKPHPVTATFFIPGVLCASCVDAITESVRQVRSVTDVRFDAEMKYALVSFDTHVSSYHQIAQAVRNARPQHGEEYQATLKMRVPDYAKGANKANVDAVFARRRDWVTVETVDAARGEFVIHFLPLRVDRQQEGPQGWNAGHFGHAIHDPAPKGLGLAFQIVREGQAARPAAKKK